MVQQPLNPAVLEAARQLLDRTTLRWPDALQLGAALAARDMFQGTEIIFVSASTHLLEAAEARGSRFWTRQRKPRKPRGTGVAARFKDRVSGSSSVLTAASSARLRTIMNVSGLALGRRDAAPGAGASNSAVGR